MEDSASVDITEVEVAPAMIEAGVEVLEWFDPAEASPEMRRDIVSEIYEVMARLKCGNQKLSPESSSAGSANSSPLG